VGLPPATAIWQRQMGIQDGIRHPEERCPKEAVVFPASSELTHTAFVAEQTMEFIANHTAQPFLCISGFYSPHSPWIAPQEFLDLYDPDSLSLPTFPPEVNAKRSENHFSDAELRSVKHGYYAMISEVDHHIGRILDHLDQLGIADNTIVVFTSDHGEWLGEHLRYGKGYPACDCISRVPLIIRWPRGVREPGVTISHIAEAIDVIPTLLHGAGIPLPPHLQGRVLQPFVADAPEQELALTEHRGWKALRIPGFRYVLHDDGRESLFDLTTDPGEYQDVSRDPEYADTLAEARHILSTRLLATERPLTRVWPY